MLTPVLPLLSILAVFTALEVARFCAARTSLQFTWVSLGVASLITMIGVGAFDYPFRREIVLLDRPYHAEENEANTNIGLAINAVTAPEAGAGVFWAGAIPYYADRRGVDFLGKADPTIARLQPDLSGVLGGYDMSTLPGHNKYDLDYSIKTLQPTYIQWFLWGQQNVGAWAEQQYELAEYRNVFLIVRKDSPDVLWDRVDARQPLVLAQ